MADIFLSYSSEDRERVQPLVEVFQAAGWSVWWDRNIRLGESYDDAIDAAVKDARCVVTVWTESSVASRWVKNESMVGLERGVFVPVMLDPVELPIAFKTAQAADLTQWDGQPEGLADVASAIHGREPP
ncbi:MAG: toll/interleukin-1 receptor domain-containing protein [Proteobacteria bacterium]|nr:toll/interleukin-1 receptor domain-containing protein [Pseudomonadota bacterium]